MKALADKLAGRIAGEVLVDEFSRHVYSIDASICQLRPQLVVCPRRVEDVLAALELARDEGIPVTPRGAATGTTGGCLGSGLVFDFGRHMTRIVELNAEAGYAICEPGVVQD